jgi:hypothetical protein
VPRLLRWKANQEENKRTKCKLIFRTGDIRNAYKILRGRPERNRKRVSPGYRGKRVLNCVSNME